MEKRDAITRAARMVFARDGYARAAIGTIAAEAGVSTRTIYNHFDGKEQLFATVIRESSAPVTDALSRIMERHLGRIGTAADLERALVALGCEWTSPQRHFAEHFAIVRHIYVEGPQLPSTCLSAWQDAGPGQAERELARHLRSLASQGLLRITDAQRSAEHFLLLTVGAVANQLPSIAADPIDEKLTIEIVSAGVHAFLNGYGA
ncbi:TetR/AcrR family transcriptional regulator [Nocardia otitidiscaviarum]|uniref:TetR/AcrR family transcriptional regulator n=1 Tax=Nocardia otitidiscaviarum TaxID=1823 RepID=UPI0024549A49|nr:TetR/AcrR family transcriptional regulator [Nocardia otitidiscaviarum]